MFGDDVADDVRPTVSWLKRQAGLGHIDCTRIARTVFFSVEDIQSLARQHAFGAHGLPKHTRRRTRSAGR